MADNKIIEKEEYNILLINSPKYGNIKVFIDKEDTPKVLDIHWGIDKDRHGKFYVRNRYKNLRLHRLVMECPEDKVIDHINHNTLDNRKSNLRICTISENNCNTNLENKYPNKSTGIYGISIWNIKCIRNNKEYKYKYFKVQYKDFKRRVFKDLQEAKAYLEQCRKEFKDNGRL